MHFQKIHLDGNHYNWIEDEKQLFTGQPSRRSFDRFNGNQVLFLINLYGSFSERFTLNDGKSIEQRILHDLPTEAKSEISVFHWIRNIFLLTK